MRKKCILNNDMYCEELRPILCDDVNVTSHNNFLFSTAMNRKNHFIYTLEFHTLSYATTTITYILQKIYQYKYIQANQNWL